MERQSSLIGGSIRPKPDSRINKNLTAEYFLPDNPIEETKHGSSDGRAVELESGDPGFESRRRSRSYENVFLI